MTSTSLPILTPSPDQTSLATNDSSRDKVHHIRPHPCRTHCHAMHTDQPVRQSYDRLKKPPAPRAHPLTTSCFVSRRCPTFTTSLPSSSRSSRRSTLAFSSTPPTPLASSHIWNSAFPPTSCFPWYREWRLHSWEPASLNTRDQQNFGLAQRTRTHPYRYPYSKTWPRPCR